jgi:hypothetical protein
MNGKLIFSKFCSISSYPCEDFHFNDLTISLISLFVTGAIFIFEKGCLNTLKRNVRASCTLGNVLTFICGIDVENNYL